MSQQAAFPEEFTTNIAVVVGINEYEKAAPNQKDIPKLSTPVYDAEALAELLQSSYGYHVRLLLNEQASRKGIEEALTGALRDAEGKEREGANTRLLFYFAGHGAAQSQNDLEAPEGFLLPSDAKDDMNSFLPMADVEKWLNALGCRHTLVVMDCCFAGAFRWATGQRAVRPTSQTLFAERYRHYLRHTACQAIASAAYDQKAQDTTVAGKALGKRGAWPGNHSPFAHLLLDALRDGTADINKDGVLTVNELIVHLQEIPGQNPELFPLPRHEQGLFVFRRKGADPLKSAPPPRNPYRGLGIYDAKDRPFFKGREGETERLEQKVIESPLTVVAGASGTGKSSLVRAGLLPRLAGERGYAVLPPVRPGPDPFASLVALPVTEDTEDRRGDAPAVRYVPATDIFGKDPPTGPDALTNAVREWREKGGRKLVLTIDQAEEFITATPTEGRGNFLQALRRAAETMPDDLRIVLTVRADFEPQLRTAFEGEEKEGQKQDDRDSLWGRGRFPIAALTEDELREVVEGPASEVNVFFESPKLVSDLVREVSNMPGALPLLSFTLTAMFDEFLQRKDLDTREITQHDYDTVGGVIGSLRRRADELYDCLPDDAHRQTMRRLMLRMIATGGDLARRRVYEDETDYPAPSGPFRALQGLDPAAFWNWLQGDGTEPENPFARLLRDCFPDAAKADATPCPPVPPLFPLLDYLTHRRKLSARQKQIIQALNRNFIAPNPRDAAASGEKIERELREALAAWTARIEAQPGRLTADDRRVGVLEKRETLSRFSPQEASETAAKREARRRDLLEAVCPSLRCERSRVRYIRELLLQERLIQSGNEAAPRAQPMPNAASGRGTPDES